MSQSTPTQSTTKSILLQPCRDYSVYDDWGATNARARKPMRVRVEEGHLVFHLASDYEIAVFHCGPEQLAKITAFAASVFQEPDPTPGTACDGTGVQP